MMAPASTACGLAFLADRTMARNAGVYPTVTPRLQMGGYGALHVAIISDHDGICDCAKASALRARGLSTSRTGYLRSVSVSRRLTKCKIGAATAHPTVRVRVCDMPFNDHVSMLLGHCSHGFGPLDLWYPGGSCASV